MTTLTSKSLLAIGVATLTVLAGAPQAAQAQTLNNGAVITPSQTFTSADLGELVAEQAVSGFRSLNGLTLDFEARSAVYRNSGGTLDFLYQVANLGTSSEAIGRFTTSIYPQDVTAILFYSTSDVDGAGVFTAGSEVPDLATRDGDGNPIGFNFLASNNGRITPGESSAVVLVRTDARDYDLGPLAVIDGAATTVQGYAPVSDSSTGSQGNVIPEPGTMALLGTGILAMAGIATRRRKQA